jgi:hypothetical protein
MTQIHDKYKVTLEELKKWGEKLDELGMTAIAGKIMSDEEYNARIQSVIDGSCFKKYLNGVLRKKESVLKKLADLEEIEQQAPFFREFFADLLSRVKSGVPRSGAPHLIYYVLLLGSNVLFLQIVLSLFFSRS